MNDGSERFVVEVQRESNTESYLGVYFTANNGLSRTEVNKIAMLIQKKKGVASWVEGFSDCVGYRMIKHVESKDDWLTKMRAMVFHKPHVKLNHVVES